MDSAAKLQKRFLLLGHTFSASLLTCKKKNEKHRFLSNAPRSFLSRYRYRYRYRYRFLLRPL